MKTDSTYSQYTEPIDVLLPTETFLMHITQMATIHNVCADAPLRHLEI
jgi:hypothetical protein